MAEVVMVPSAAIGPTTYTLGPLEYGVLRVVQWDQAIVPPGGNHVPEVRILDPSGNLLARCLSVPLNP